MEGGILCKITVVFHFVPKMFQQYDFVLGVLSSERNRCDIGFTAPAPASAHQQPMLKVLLLILILCTLRERKSAELRVSVDANESANHSRESSAWISGCVGPSYVHARVLAV